MCKSQYVGYETHILTVTLFKFQTFDQRTIMIQKCFECNVLKLSNWLSFPQYGSAAKFPGSGGAVIGLCLDETHKVVC